MTLGETLAAVGDWLLNEPVHRALLLVLALLQILLWGYMLIAHHRVHMRLLSVELRHEGLIQRTSANAGDIGTLKRNTDANIKAIVQQSLKKERKKT